jgi:hypothetical protein
MGLDNVIIGAQHGKKALVLVHIEVAEIEML